MFLAYLVGTLSREKISHNRLYTRGNVECVRIRKLNVTFKQKAETIHTTTFNLGTLKHPQSNVNGEKKEKEMKRRKNKTLTTP